MRRILTATFALLALAAPLGAQRIDDRYAPAVLQLPASTRALGMADAFPVGASDSDAVFYNLALSQNISGLTASAQRWGAGATMLTMSAAAEWFGGRVALGVMALDFAPPLFIEGDPGGELDESTLFGTGQARSDGVIAVGYTRRIKGIRVGAVGKGIVQRYFGERETTVALDLSAGHVLGPVNLGVAVQNIGPSASFDEGDADSPLRATLAAATTRSWPLGPLDVLPAASVAVTVEGTVIPAAGLEVGYWPIAGRTFFARAGLRDPQSPSAEPWTVGAGFAGDRIALDWAFASFDEGGTHRVSVRWR